MSLIAAIEKQENLAETRGELSNDRAQAMDHYLGRPYGNEVEGRSSVVMRDVADTIEWIKPSLMKIFASGDEVVKFEAVGPEDEPSAEQETQYCNHVLMRRNNGFLIFHDWFHDALLQKTGYVLADYIEEKQSSKESYKGLSEDERALLLQGEEVEILEEMAYPGPIGIAYDMTVRCVRPYGYVKVQNIAPENVAVASDWPHATLKGCPFVRVIDYKTISELRNLGYDVDDDISDNSTSFQGEYEEQNRQVEIDTFRDRDDIEADPTTRRVKVRYVWMNYDEDGDGIAELRKVVVVGTTILENEETDITPIASLTPFRMPHEHYGLSVDDIVSDLQEIRTSLTRGFLDNMYLRNNGRYAIDANVVNLDDMLVSRPGGVVRMNSSQPGAIIPLTHPSDGGEVLQAIQYVDEIRSNRTGVTKYTQGIDSNSLNKTAHGISQIMTAAQQRIDLIARIFAETGVKELMLIVHAMSIKNGRKPEMVKLRNEWIPVDPRSWKYRRDASVSVGLGTGDKDQMLQHLMMILQAQKEGLMLGLTSPPKIYNALAKLTQNAGFKQPEMFWDDPTKTPPKPQPPSPEQIKAQTDLQTTQMDIQARTQETQTKLQADAQKFQANAQLEMAKMEHERRMKEMEFQHQAQLAAMQEATKVEIEKMKMDATADLQEAKNMATMAGKDAEISSKEALAAKDRIEGVNEDVISGLLQTMGALAKAIQSPKELYVDPKTGKKTVRAIQVEGEDPKDMKSMMEGLVNSINAPKELIVDPQTGRKTVRTIQ